MKWYRRFLLDQETQSSDAATRRVPLPRTGVLSGIELRLACTNGATSGLERLFDSVDRVEVVADGSNTLFSLEGTELYRWAHAIIGKEPAHVWDEGPGVVQRLTLPVLFGRAFGDDEWGLDLSQFRDVELRVQYSPTIAATGFVTGTFQIHAVMWIADNPNNQPGVRGYIRTTQVKAFTTAASGDDITELARRYSYLDMLVYCREAAIADGVDITRALIRANDGAWVPFDGRWDDIQAMNETAENIDGTHKGVIFAGDADTVDLHTGRILSAFISPYFTQSDANGIVTVNIASAAGDRITVSASDLADAAATTHFTASAADRRLNFTAKGLGIGSAIHIPFGDKGDVSDALDPRELARLQLVLTQGADGGITRISTRELVGA
jgi:hypothetical protein